MPSTMSDRQLRPRPHRPTQQPDCRENRQSSSPSPSEISSASVSTLGVERSVKSQRITESHSAPSAETHPIAASSRESREQAPFHPIISAYASHNAYNKLPLRLHFMPSLPPDVIFGLSLPYYFLETIAVNTNSYHVIHVPHGEGKEGGRWVILSAVEL